MGDGIVGSFRELESDRAENRGRPVGDELEAGGMFTQTLVEMRAPGLTLRESSPWSL